MPRGLCGSVLSMAPPTGSRWAPVATWRLPLRRSLDLSTVLWRCQRPLPLWRSVLLTCRTLLVAVVPRRCVSWGWLLLCGLWRGRPVPSVVLRGGSLVVRLRLCMLRVPVVIHHASRVHRLRMPICSVPMLRWHCVLCMTRWRAALRFVPLRLCPVNELATLEGTISDDAFDVARD